MTICEKAYGKINLCLDIVGIRPNGYHNIESVMHTVPLFDTLTLSESNTISISCENPKVPTDSSNIAYKASELFFESTGICKGVSIHIEKRIPVAAGMAGGSTNAAAVLKGLNRLYGFPLNSVKLEELGAKLGADVPFCIRGGTEGVLGIGYDFIKVTPPPKFIYVISCCNNGISTPAMYKEYDKRYSPKTVDSFQKEFTGNSKKLEEALAKGDKEAIFGSMFNCFEEIAMEQRSEIKEHKAIMMKHDAQISMMSGSGPSVFGIFESIEKAKNAEKEILSSGSFAVALCDE